MRYIEDKEFEKAKIMIGEKLSIYKILSITHFPSFDNEYSFYVKLESQDANKPYWLIAFSDLKLEGVRFLWKHAPFEIKKYKWKPKV